MRNFFIFIFFLNIFFVSNLLPMSYEQKCVGAGTLLEEVPQRDLQEIDLENSKIGSPEIKKKVIELKLSDKESIFVDFNEYYSEREAFVIKQFNKYSLDELNKCTILKNMYDKRNFKKFISLSKKEVKFFVDEVLNKVMCRFVDKEDKLLENIFKEKRLDCVFIKNCLLPKMDRDKTRDSYFKQFSIKDVLIFFDKSLKIFIYEEILKFKRDKCDFACDVVVTSDEKGAFVVQLFDDFKTRLYEQSSSFRLACKKEITKVVAQILSKVEYGFLKEIDKICLDKKFLINLLREKRFIYFIDQKSLFMAVNVNEISNKDLATFFKIVKIDKIEDCKILSASMIGKIYKEVLKFKRDRYDVDRVVFVTYKIDAKDRFLMVDKVQFARYSNIKDFIY